MDQKFCQSCGMPLSDELLGTNADGSKNEDYCIYCYKGGEFTQNFNMSQMIEFCARYTDQMNEQAGWNMTPDQAKAQMRQFFPTLKRWMQRDERSLIEKAASLLEQCEEVTLATINSDGFPRPVPIRKIHSNGCNEIWMATDAASVKAKELSCNPKAGVSYYFYGDSVALRGSAEIIDDDSIRTQMWQEWMINHFPNGAADPNYTLIKFTGVEATIYIDGEFARTDLAANV